MINEINTNIYKYLQYTNIWQWARCAWCINSPHSKFIFCQKHLPFTAASSSIVSDGTATFHTRSNPGHSLTDIRVNVERSARVTDIYRYIITMTSQWAWLRLKSPASRLFTQPVIQTQIKENIKAPRHWPLCGEFTGDRWIPRTKGQ